jgi:hypothetical protein
MFDLILTFEQFLFISALLSLFIVFYRLPSITNFFNHKSSNSHKVLANKFASNLVIKRFSQRPALKILIFSFQRLKIKYSRNKDLEDCCFPSLMN